MAAGEETSAEVAIKWSVCRLEINLLAAGNLPKSCLRLGICFLRTGNVRPQTYICRPRVFFDVLQLLSIEMATLADELLNDFEDSGSEDDNRQNDFLGDDGQEQQNILALKHEIAGVRTEMELEGGDEEIEDAEEELAAQNGAHGLDDVPDEEETKAKVEKMKLGGVADVRSVAVLMKTLQPVLEVIMSLSLALNLSQMSLCLHLR